MTSISSTQAVFVVEPNIGIVEPGDTLAIQITFQPPAVLGIYQADLVIQATTGTTQIPMQGAVVLPTTLSHAPDTLRATTPSGSRDTVWLTLNNTGPSNLTYSLSAGTIAGGSGSSFYESFENPLNDKFTLLTGNYSAERISVPDAPHGNRVLSVTGGNNDAGSGLWAEVSSETFTYMSYWFKPLSPGGVSSVIRWWNQQEIIVNIWHTAAPDQITININGSPIRTFPCSTNAWHRFEIRNMDHSLRTCDLYLDGQQVVGGLQWNYDLTNVRRIQLSNWDFSSAYFDQVRLNTENGQTLAVHFPEGDSGSVSPGQSRQIPVEFNAEGVDKGWYEGEIEVQNNSQNLPSLLVPFQWSVTAGKKFLLRTDTLDLGKVYVGVEAKEPLYWVNAGSDPLLVFETTASTSSLKMLPPYGVVPGLDSLEVALSYTAGEPGPVLEHLAIKSTGGNADLWIKAQAVHAPVAHLMPDSICLTLIQGQDSTVQVQWSNTGLADLEVHLSTGGPQVNPTLRVLHTGTSSASRKPAEILRDSSIQVTEWYNPGLLPNFSDYDLVLFPRDYNFDAWPFMSWTAPISKYVQEGGQVLFSGRLNYDLPGTLGLMKGNQYFLSHYAGDPQTLWPSRPAEVFEGMPLPLVYQDEMASMQHHPTAFQPWVSSSQVGGALVGAEALGKGRSGYVPYDFQQSNPASRRLLLNMIRWMTGRYLPRWVQSSTPQVSAAPGQTQALPISFVSDSLPTGEYRNNLIFFTNDPTQPSFSLPVKIIVVAKPKAQFTANKNSTCNGKVIFQNTTLNEAISYLWDFDDGSGSSAANPTHQYAADGSYNVRLIACNVLGCDTLLRKNLIQVDLGGSFCDTLLMPADKSRRIADECSGVIYDAGGLAGGYANNQAGQVLIRTEPGTRIRLRLDEYDAACCSDYLQVFDGNDLSATPLIWVSTSVNAPLTVQSKTNELLVNFSSDQGNTAGGFSIHYTCGSSFPPLAQFYYAHQGCPNFVAFQSNSLDAEKLLWDFGDNTTSTQSAPLHVFKSTGTYPVTLYAIRGSDTSAYTQSVQIDQVAFYADINYPQIAKVNTPTTFSVTSPYPISNIYWDINGQTAFGLLPVVATFPQTGIFPVRVTVQASNGCSIYHEGTIVVGLTGTSQPGNSPEALSLQVSPNPGSTDAQVQVGGTSTGTAAWQIHDQLGRLVAAGSWEGPGELHERLDLAALHAGLYWLTVTRDTAARRIKVVKVD
ncbi:MAG TPA: PKD domain-containing protein [Saprospiraceae bacterium]|nr:PKD domain-containing protein [Saprospiraceae bacterium]